MSSIGNCLGFAVVMFLILIWYYFKRVGKPLSIAFFSEEELIFGKKGMWVNVGP